MQRRKILSKLKNKPKLILQRQSLNTNKNPQSQEFIPMSVAKIPLSKQNRRNPIKRQQSQFFELNKYKNESQKMKFNIRFATTTKSDHTFSKPQKQNIVCPNLSDHTENEITQFISKTIKSLKLCPKIFHFSGDLTISQIFLSKIIRIIIKQSSLNSYILNNITQKLNNLFQKQEKVSYSHKDLFNTKKKLTTFLIEPIFSQSFCFQTIKKQNINDLKSNKKQSQPIIFSLKEQIQNFELQQNNLSQLSSIKITDNTSKLWEKIDEQNKFIFEHLSNLENYILNQPNKILHQAVRRHKYLEQELFAYADLLTISKLGIQTYTPQINIHNIESNIDKRLKQLNKMIIQGQQSLQLKCKNLRDFAVNVHSDYKKIINELLKSIDTKTSYTKNFVNKITKWEENYLTRKQYLSNLKKDYCKQLYSITIAINALRENASGLVNCENSKFISIIQESMIEIDKIFLMGNSFY